MPLKDHIKNEKDYFHFKIKRLDIGKYLRYQFFIQEQLEKRNPKLVKVFKKYLQLTKFIEWEIDEFHKKDLKEKTEAVCKHFLRIKKYDKGNVLFDFQNLIMEVISSIHVHEFEKGKVELDDFIVNCYTFLDIHWADYDSLHKDSKFSHYQKGAISAYIALLFGYRIRKDIDELFKDGKNIPPEELFDAIKSPIKKFK